MSLLLHREFIVSSMESIHTIRAERYEQEKFYAWTVKVNARIPALAKRVFKLRGNSTKLISLEAQLGNVMRHLNSNSKFFPKRIDRLADQVLTQVLTSELFREVARREQTIKENRRIR